MAVGLVSFIFQRLYMDSGTLEEAHSVNEKVEIEQLIEFTKVITAFIYEWCHTKNRFV